MTSTYEIVSYCPAHKGQVAALQTNLWTTDVNQAARYLEWKHEENPYVKEPLIYLAFHGRELVGMRGFYGARWEVGSPPGICSVVVADDFVIAPQHRDRGLATIIMKAAFEDLARRGHQYVFNLSGGQATVLGSLAMGWKSAGPLEPIGLETRSDVARYARGLLARTPSLRRSASSPLFRFVREPEPFSRLDRTSHPRSGSIAIEQEARPDAMSELVTRLGHDGRLRHVRDPEFFAWRFRNPLRVYRFLYYGNSRLDGYLVLKYPHPTAKESKRVTIADLEATQPSVRAELLDAAINLGRFPELFAWAVTLPDDTRSHLSSRGFKPVDLESRAHGCPCVLVRPVSPQPPGNNWVLGNRRLTDLANWDLRMLYSMSA